MKILITGICGFAGSVLARGLVPWLVLDSSRARERFGWQPATHWKSVLEEIAAHAEKNPRWLELTAS